MTIDVPPSSRLTLQLDAIRKKPTTTGDSAHSRDRVPFTVLLLSAEGRIIHFYGVLEFDVQGLELDWAYVCWEANFRREGDNW
jgi:hypothetical protein